MTTTASASRIAGLLCAAAVAASGLAAASPAAASAATTAPTSTATVVTKKATKTTKPRLKVTANKRTLVVKTRKPGRLAVKTVTTSGTRSTMRVSALRKKTRIALPASVATVKARTVTPTKSAWAKLTVTPGTGTPGTPGNPGNPGNSGDDGTGTPNYTDSPIPAEQHRNAIAVLNQARTAGGYCGGTYYPPQPALRENALLTEIAVYSAQRLADPYSPPTAPTPRESSWLALSRNPAALGQPFSEATVGEALADKVAKGQGCAAVHDPKFSDVGVGLAYSYPKIDGQPVAAATHANLVVMLGTP